MRFSLPDARAARPDQFFGAADMRLQTARNCAEQFSILSPGENAKAKRTRLKFSRSLSELVQCCLAVGLKKTGRASPA